MAHSGASGGKGVDDTALDMRRAGFAPPACTQRPGYARLATGYAARPPITRAAIRAFGAEDHPHFARYCASCSSVTMPFSTALPRQYP